jgi:hypothetical protein
MTDAATPVPTGQTPEPTSHRRLYIILAAIVIAVIALFAGLFLYASSAAGGKVSDYDDAYAQWKAKEKPILLAATKKVPTGTYVIKNSTTTKGLATQKKGCDAVTASLKDVDAASDRLPKMGTNGLLGKVSSDYSDAGDKSDRRAKVVRAYVKAASGTLTQLERDCRWNIARNTAAVKSEKAWDKGKKYLLKPGETEPGGIFCPQERGTTCVSSITKKKNTYADLRIKATKLYGSTTLKFYSPKECGETSYGAACRVIFKAYSDQNNLQLKNYRYVRAMKSSVNNSTLTEKNKKLDKLADRNEPKIRKAVLGLDPALKRDKKIRKYPTWTDRFLGRMGKLLLADLKDERATIGKL